MLEQNLAIWPADLVDMEKIAIEWASLLLSALQVFSIKIEICGEGVVDQYIFFCILLLRTYLDTSCLVEDLVQPSLVIKSSYLSPINSSPSQRKIDVVQVTGTMTWICKYDNLTEIGPMAEQGGAMAWIRMEKNIDCLINNWRMKMTDG